MQEKHVYAVKYSIGYRKYNGRRPVNGKIEEFDDDTSVVLADDDARSAISKAMTLAMKETEAFEETREDGSETGIMFKPERFRLIEVEHRLALKV
jgi:hypothetical protein